LSPSWRSIPFQKEEAGIPFTELNRGLFLLSQTMIDKVPSPLEEEAFSFSYYLDALRAIFSLVVVGRKMVLFPLTFREDDRRFLVTYSV